MENCGTWNFKNFREILGLKGSSQGILTTLSLASKILPYYGYAHQCKTLMTQLRSGSRAIWLNNQNILLRSYPDKDDGVRYILKKRPLLISKAFGNSRLLKSNTTLLKFHEFMTNDDSKLFEITIRLKAFDLKSLRIINKVLDNLDSEVSSVKFLLMCGYRSNNVFIDVPEIVKVYSKIADFCNKEILVDNSGCFPTYIFPECLKFDMRKASYITEKSCILFTNCLPFPEYENMDPGIAQSFIEGQFCSRQYFKLFSQYNPEEIWKMTRKSTLTLKICASHSLDDSSDLKNITEILMDYEKCPSVKDSQFKEIILNTTGLIGQFECNSQKVFLWNLYDMYNLCYQKKIELSIQSCKFAFKETAIKGAVCYIYLEDKFLKITNFCGRFSKLIYKCSDYFIWKLDISQFSGKLVEGETPKLTRRVKYLTNEWCAIIFINQITHIETSLARLESSVVQNAGRGIIFNTTIKFLELLKEKTFAKLEKLNNRGKLNLRIEMTENCNLLSPKSNIDLSILRYLKLTELHIKVYLRTINKELNGLAKVLQNQKELEFFSLSSIDLFCKNPLSKEFQNLHLVLKNRPYLRKINIVSRSSFPLVTKEVAKTLLIDKITAEITIKHGCECYFDTYHKLCEEL
ncbi:unnamed protein product [Moneuplotes crassus]|uniref:Uncharacterized protein n=1 Tax=Euplotes crassus TaxID=5936 RepID=A0AAD1U599_EUPCR|nr:unnamed protein product [Moneuplotes crassus]